MLFNSLAFAIFLPIVFTLYWACPAKIRWIFLLAISYFFVANLDLRYAVVLFGTTVFSYFFGRAIAYTRGGRYEKVTLVCGVGALALELMIFKYTMFALESVAAVAKTFSLTVQVPTLSILLPVGISFYVFQTIGYLVDVYRGTIPVEKHFGYFALFVSFFPELMSGPIARAGDLLPQYKKKRRMNHGNVTYGLKLMAWGYFKKLAVADVLAGIVNQVYDHPDSYIGLVFIVIPIMYSIEIYCDFSGYSDIAIGTARLFGVVLKPNFNSPYYSASVKEFWGRWHISLSSWLRDYIYIPLGGSRCSKAKHIRNLMITFLISGLWHGANWTFVIWGGLHGLYQSVESLWSRHVKERGRLNGTDRKMLPHAVRVLITFLLVNFAWIFFRADSLSVVYRFLSCSLQGLSDPIQYLKTFIICMDMDYLQMVWMALPVILLMVADALSLKKDMIISTGRLKPYIKYPLYMVFVLLILVFAEKGVATEFIYSAF